MEIEEAMILALNEPRSFNEWFDEALRLRKLDGQTLSRTSFSDAKEQFVKDGLIIETKVDGRKKQFTINRNSIDTYEWIKSIEKELMLWRDDCTNALSKVNSMSQNKKKVMIKGEQSSKFLTNIIHDTFLVQKKVHLYKISGLYSKASKVKLTNCIKICDNIIHDCFTFIQKLDDGFFFSIYMSEQRKIDNELDPKWISDYTTNIEKTFDSEKTKSKLFRQRVLRASRHH